jgi:hypothetical protein
MLLWRDTCSQLRQYGQAQRPDVQVLEQQSRLSRQPRPAARQTQRPAEQSM